MKTNVDSEPIVRHPLAPIPWCSAIAGTAASGLVVLVVHGLIGDDQLQAFMAMPVLISLWLIAAAGALRSPRADNVAIVTTFGFVVGVFWTLDIPYGSGSTGWNVALLIAGPCSLALAEWTLTRPSMPKWAFGAVALILGGWFVV